MCLHRTPTRPHRAPTPWVLSPLRCTVVGQPSVATFHPTCRPLSRFRSLCRPSKTNPKPSGAGKRKSLIGTCVVVVMEGTLGSAGNAKRHDGAMRDGTGTEEKAGERMAG